jgi:hypothetical protein
MFALKQKMNALGESSLFSSLLAPGKAFLHLPGEISSSFHPPERTRHKLQQIIYRIQLLSSRMFSPTCIITFKTQKIMNIHHRKQQ